ncbi:MAG: aldo/keto reductase [Bacillota bacterium]
MLYREYGKTKKLISAIGFGSTRFNPADLNDEEGLQRCAELVYLASEQGVNYFDIAHNYSKSQCEAIYKIAFKMLKKPFFTSAKSSSFQEKTADDVLRRIESSLEKMDINKIDFFYIWSIMNEEHYMDIMKKGGSYEGGLRAKEQGLISHIVFSSHAVPDVAVKIINDRVFEGITVSYNPLNYQLMDKVIKAAAENNMGVAVMNPLAGGFIPQNKDFFSKLIEIENETVAQAALRFIYSHPEITCVLSGFSSEQEIHENTVALNDETEISQQRIEVFEGKLRQMTGFCTGCGYCRICPQNIPIPEYMQSYNMSFFESFQDMYGRSDEALIKRISVFRKLVLDFQILLENSQNPCIRCGKCEKICTQHLPIMGRIDELLEWAEISCSTRELYKERLDELLNNKNYKKVGFFTAGGYTAYVIEYYKKFFGDFDFDVFIFDSNRSKWGGELAGYTVYSPEKILEIKPDCIIISNYIYSQEIFESLKHYEDEGIKIIPLHKENDVPWI